LAGFRIVRGGALIDDAPKMPRVIHGAALRAPDARDAVFSTATIRIVERAIHLAARVAPANFDTPSAPFCMPDRVLDLLLRMPGSFHG